NTFMYSQFACMVGCLIESHGKETLFRYIGKLVDGEGQNAAFRAAFGAELSAFVTEFRLAAQRGERCPLRRESDL
ncbi:MAG TPA: hypothetical protein PLG27_10530, partial [Candidatus Latescibacteria bacterium]|nr:hypothetical protein [Candidatus Latescibacterota bacterium]